MAGSHAALPDDGKVNGELAVTLFIHARRDARTVPDGTPIPLADQDRTPLLPGDMTVDLARYRYPTHVM